jgi:hypothetical protein
MTAELTDWRTPRGKVGALSRSRKPNDPALIAARNDLRVARLADHIARVVAEAPPLTDEQSEQLAALLRPTVGGAHAAAS